MTTEATIAERISKIQTIPEAERQWREDQAKHIEQQDHHRKVEALLVDSRIPLRQRIADLDRSGEWESTFQKLATNLTTGFLTALVGTRGNGKTQIGVELVKANSERLKTSRFCCATEFFMDIKASYKREGSTEKDVVREYQRPALLVIDEIGQRSDSDWENRLLFFLVNERYQAMKDTLFIGNLEPSQLTAALGPSIASRMNETGGVINCSWTSFRR